MSLPRILHIMLCSRADGVFLLVLILLLSGVSREEGEDTHCRHRFTECHSEYVSLSIFPSSVLVEYQTILPDYEARVGVFGIYSR